MDRIGLMGLLRIELPGPVTVNLCDGGFLVWGADTFAQRHATFGVIASIQAMGEGTGQEVPALELTLLPDGDASPSSLSAPGYQNSRVRLWLAQFSADTGLLVGTPQLQFDGQLDQTILRTTADGTRELAITVVSTAERLFARNAGNTLNPSFHKSVWSGETGHDNATGLTFAVAWGTEAPPGGGRTFVQNPGGFLGVGGSQSWV